MLYLTKSYKMLASIFFFFSKDGDLKSMTFFEWALQSIDHFVGCYPEVTASEEGAQNLD